MDKSVQVSEPSITSITSLFTSKIGIFNNVDSTNVITNSNDEDVTIPPGYYTIGEIIAILNTMTDTMFSISTKASSYGYFWIQSPHTIDLTNAPDIREILGLEGRAVILSMSWTWLISRVIAKWSKYIQHWSDPPIWRLQTRTTIYSTQWSLTIPRPTTVDRWRISAFQW